MQLKVPSTEMLEKCSKRPSLALPPSHSQYWHRQLAVRPSYHVFKARCQHIVLHLIRLHSACPFCFLVRILDGLYASSARSCISRHLPFDVPVHCSKEIGGSINGLRDCQNAVILQHDGLLGPERLCDASTFLMRKYNAAKVLVDGVVVVEPASIPFDGCKLAPKGRESLSADCGNGQQR